MISGFRTYTRTFTFGDQTIQLILPDVASVQQHYTASSVQDKTPVFPFWSKLWPASVGLCEFIAAQPHYIKDKTVLELAAGLGLPSLLSSQSAKQVLCTDIVPEAIDFAQQSAILNKVSIICNVRYWIGIMPMNCIAILCC